MTLRNRTLALSIFFMSLTMACFNNCTNLHQESLPVTAADAAFACTPGTPPITDQVVRLTGQQFQNTLSSIITRGLAASDVANYQTFLSSSSVTNILQSFPAEGSYAKGNAMIYDTEDQRLSPALLQSQVSLALATAQWIVSNAARLTYFVNYFAGGTSCAGLTGFNTAASQACYDAFIKGFGLRVLRRPVETTNNTIDANASDPNAANDLYFYEGVFTDPSSGGFDALITTMLLSPDSLFLNPLKGSVASDGVTVTLTSYETAAKLAYYYTDNPPDELLLAAATAGFSGTGNTIPEQAARLFASPLARTRFADFYTQWIRPSAIPALVTASNSPNTDLTQLRANAIQEMVDLTDYYTFGVPIGKLSDLATSNISFAKTADLAAIYGVGVWPGKNPDGSYDPTTLVQFPADNPRAGLFTRAGYAFSGARDNNLIIRGSRIRKDYLCENLTPPAAFALSTTIPINGPPTVRNIVIANTQNPGTSCVGCHGPLINPLGFALENYDAFGRYRTLEPIFNTDGSIAETVPVNATSQPFESTGDSTETTNGIDFSTQLGQDLEFNGCFARHYFRFTQARVEDDKADACTLNRMLGSLVNDPVNGSIQNLIHTTATDPHFQTRYINP